MEDKNAIIAKCASAYEVEGEDPKIPNGFVKERRARFGEQHIFTSQRLESDSTHSPASRRSYIIVRSTVDGSIDTLHSSAGNSSALQEQPTSSLPSTPCVRVHSNDTEGHSKQRPKSYQSSPHHVDTYHNQNTEHHSPLESSRFPFLSSQNTRPTQNIRGTLVYFNTGEPSSSHQSLRSSQHHGAKKIPITIGRQIDVHATILRPTHPMKVDVVRIEVARPSDGTRGGKSVNRLDRNRERRDAREEYREDTKEWTYDSGKEENKKMNEDAEEKEALRLHKELEDAREMNRQLSIELARVEREKQQFDIDQTIKEKKNDAEVASRVANAICTINLHRSPETGLKRKRDTQYVESTLQRPAESLNPDEIRRNLERMMSCIKEIPVRTEEKEELTNQQSCPYTIQTATEDSSESTLLEDKHDWWKMKEKNAQLRAEMGDLKNALDRSTILLDQMSSSVRFIKRPSSPSHTGSLGSSISGDDDHLHDHSELISLRSQIQIQEQQISNKELLIKRLERDLEDAQQCNQKLNSQLGTLATNGGTKIKKEIIEIKKELKDRTNEVDQLKKKLQKADKDIQTLEAQKRQLESKLPTDIQTLIAQKRELTQQLDREQNEKHELFMQINSMIAQLADTSGESNKGEVDGLKAENEMLRQRLLDVENFTNKENHKLSEDLRRIQQECEMQKVAFDLEKKQMSSELQQLQANIAMKSAALQSLMLAKQEPKLDTAELEQLREEKENLQKEISDLKKTIDQQKKYSESQISEFTTNIAVLSSQLEDSKTKQGDAETKLKNAESDLNETQRTIDALQTELRAAEDKISNYTVNVAALTSQLETSKTQERELETLTKNAENDSNESQRKIDALQLELKMAEDKISSFTLNVATLTSQLETSRAQQKELEAKAKNVESDSYETQRKTDALQTELKTAGDKISLLELELNQSKKESDTLRENAQQLENWEKEKSRELEEKLANAQNEIRKEEKLRRELQAVMDDLSHSDMERQEQITSLNEKNLSLEKKLKEKEDEYENLRSTITITQSKLDTAECEAKAARALADTNERRANALQQQLETQSGSQSEQVTLLRDQLSKSEKLESELRQKLHDQEQKAQESLRSLRQELEHVEGRIKNVTEKEMEILQELERERTRVMDKEQEMKQKVADINALQSKLDTERMNGEEHAQKIRQLEKEITELEAERKKLEAKASVADELKTLMGNLQQARQENSDLQAEIANLHNETKVLRDSVDMWQTECNEWKVRAETAESERNIEREQLITHSNTLVSLQAEKEQIQLMNAEKFEEERKRIEEEKIQALAEKDDALLQEKERAKDEKERLEREGAEKLMVLQRKYEELEKEAATSKKNLNDMNEERSRSMSDAEKEKNRLVQGSQALEEKTRKLESENEDNQRRIGELEEAVKQAKEEARISKNELVKSEDTLMALRSAADSSNDKMREAEEFATQVRKQFHEIEAENRELLEQKDLQHKAVVLIMEEKILSLESQLARSSASLQETVDALKSELEKESVNLKDVQEEKIRLQSELASKEKLIAELSSKAVNEERVKELEAENLRLSAEYLKLQEKEKIIEDAALKSEKTIEERVNGYEKRITALQAELENVTSSLQRKERDADMLKDEVKQAQMEADSSRSDYSVLQSKLRAIEFEKTKLEDELEETKRKSINGYGDSPTPVPRMNRTISNMSRMSYAESIMQTDDPDKLKGEIERQHRLIVVLRRKLQKLQ